MAKGNGVTRGNYEAELIAERLTGRPADSYTSADMLHGIETEDEARANYELAKCCEVQQVGFVDHPTIAMSGASPDGLVGEDGLLELKCPKTATHLNWVLGDTPIPRKYLLQMQWQLACTKRQWCDFASYDPRLSPELQLHVERVERDAALIRSMETEVALFLAGVSEKVERLRNLNQKEAAA
jgi:putative phage-type endonuclease